MRHLRRWLAPPRRLLLAFVLLLLLPATAVVLLGLRMIRQDRDLESRQLVERRTAAADRVAAALQQSLSASERLLTGPIDAVPIRPGDDAVVVVEQAGQIHSFPNGHLLYRPSRTSILPSSSSELSGAEALEHQKRDYRGAADRFREIAGSARRADLEAEALAGMARNLKHLGRPDEALVVYDALARLTSAPLAGIAAELAARRARIALLSEIGRTEQARSEAQTLRSDLFAARWPIDRGTFVAYADQLRQWAAATDAPDAGRLALSEAVAALFADRRDDRALPDTGRRSLRVHAKDVVVLWQLSGDRLAVFAAGPEFIEREWLSAVRTAVEARQFRVALANDTGEWIGNGPPPPDAVPARLAQAETGLPWTIAVSDADRRQALQEFVDRRRMLVVGLSLLVTLVIVGGAFTVRAVSRDLAVARLQSDFVSAVSHEFRTPLTSLRQYTDLLNDADEPSEPKRRSFYRAQARATDRLQRLVESLLDFGRMEAGARPYQQRPNDLPALVQRIVADFRRDAAPSGFSIAFASRCETGAVSADPDAVTRAVWNLLDNAVKYSGASRDVAVEVATIGQEIGIAVRDYGPGISRRERTRIFDKFFRGSATRNGEIEGTGIGLSMVRHIVAAHRGRITVDSEPGAGSTFTIWLPLVPEREQIAPCRESWSSKMNPTSRPPSMKT